jgi:diguanylate cyclase (GGDEF)-like protein/PAS domain S-box-containing protein
MYKNFTTKILDNAGIFILVWDIDGNLIIFNKYIEKNTGFSKDQVLGRKWETTIFDEGNKANFIKLLSGAQKMNDHIQHDGNIICRDGRIINVLWNSVAVHNNKGNPKVIVSMGVDITERTEAERKLNLSYQELEAVYEELAAIEEELREKYDELRKKEEQLEISEERHKAALEGSQDAIWEWDIKNGKSYISDRWREMLGFTAEELAVNHLTWKELIHPDDKELAFKRQQDHLNGITPFYRSEYRLKTKSGEYKWVSVRGKVLRDSEGIPVRIAGSQTDISERKAFEEKINRLAYYDSLTELPNRAKLEKVLGEALRTAKEHGNRGAVLFLDLDNFKTVNDTFGHEMGDDLLMGVAKLLRSFESEDILVSRFGGDEFVIVIDKIQNDQQVREVAFKIVQALNKPWIIKGKEFYSSVSLGIVFYPGDGCDVQSILSNADCAMYSVKNADKNNFKIYSSNMNLRLMERVDMENKLRHAITDNEFVLHYQPQINQKTGQIVGVEALIRWNSPSSGMISPNNFIPVAEETGLIVPIGEWVLREACRQNKYWQDKGYSKFPVSVNLSARQLKQPDLVRDIIDILNESGLDAQWLNLEITESIAISDIDFTITILKELKQIGVALALDDFGTGYSSLSYLRKLPINIIKIDKSFIDEISESVHAAAITEAIIVMSHKMNMKVIAEGVETQNQHELLQQENCDMAQGYLFSRPLAAEGIESLISLKDSNISLTV